jgi:hypothetical protein
MLASRCRAELLRNLDGGANADENGTFTKSAAAGASPATETKATTVTDVCRKSASILKAKTEAIWNEIQERKMLELEQERHARAKME